MKKILIQYSISFFLTIISLIGCHSPVAENKNISIASCDKPYNMKVESIVDYDINHETTIGSYAKFDKDKHGTIWKNEKKGNMRAIYSHDTGVLKVYENRRLIKKHNNVKVTMQNITDLNKEKCIYNGNSYQVLTFTYNKDILLNINKTFFSDNGRITGSNKSMYYYPSAQYLKYRVGQSRIEGLIDYTDF